MPRRAITKLYSAARNTCGLPYIPTQRRCRRQNIRIGIVSTCFMEFEIVLYLLDPYRTSSAATPSVVSFTLR